MSQNRYARLTTERGHPATRALDRMSALGIVRLMNREDRRAVEAVRRVLPRVARAVERIVEALGHGGRLFFVGAGTSGRLGILEAAECPPTFGTPPGMVQAVMAGGRGAVFRAREGAEDDARAGAQAMRTRVRPGDVVVGVSASGLTPFVRGALREAARRGAATMLVVANPLPRSGRARGSRTGGARPLVISLATGPEVLAGSTRLKAGTATKLVLNMLTTASMARLGRVYGHRMVDLRPRSAKLRARALRLVMELAGVSRRAAARALRASGDRVRLAVVMAHSGLDARAAGRLLRAAGSLRAVLELSRPPTRSRRRPGR